MHFIKVIVALSLVLAVAFAEIPPLSTKLEGDELVAAKNLLTIALSKLPGTKYNVVNWLSAEARSYHKYVVDISDGSSQNECTFEIFQSLPIIENGNRINMHCQGGYELDHIW
ncbi:uncharacterized protein LOC110176475 isoform X1 [Drosophila serrata]|uniref:uncharacterized protein LOC110176475 isoform X1 n=1 Tax=Drosophila serrata TaxID=7274 RepID=UPI000A1CFD15|nr:uncharacterized protein LOC110176475 isoform X1 [Drosophila serrata]